MAQPQQPNFVSSIPKNTLAPVFLGGGNGSSSNASGNSSGKFVPSFLNSDNSKKKETKDFNLKSENFPSLSGGKPGAISTNNLSGKISYSDAIKKPKLETNETKATTATMESNQKGRPAVSQRVLDDYSDYSDEYSDEYGDEYDDGYNGGQYHY
jgi:hypothetical protein